ncbi:MAG: Eco57I restriction-modification methylase domain-containing protein [Opitutales bacterium]|nr:Eco57I restriction-modification methylase domain-containing protein [Opitutales bacterium]
MPDLRENIRAALNAFTAKPLREAALDFLGTLGYRSDRTLHTGDSSPAAFLEFIESNAGSAGIDRSKALVDDWKSADLLFQLTDSELSREANLFKEEDIKPGLLRSYLFFAIELTGDHYARGKLAAIARQLNRVFPMPVMVLIKHRGTDIPVCASDTPRSKSAQTRMSAPLLSIAVINRRRNKREAHKDVLEKATIIRDISLAAPHRGHLDILDSFAFDNLVHPKREPINNFDALHAAWEEIFNVELLNKRFYRELSDWYFWAMRHCHFPLLDESSDKYFLFKDREKVREHEAKNLIRLLTRILFVWFIKERRLVPDAFFDPHALAEEFLDGFDSESKETRYYKAILQNLFFASLNQVQGKRAFRKQGQHHNTTNLLRYEAELKEPRRFIDAVEATTPFLNGGLFDCLDYPHPTKVGPQGGKVTIYEDGFSDRKDNPLVVPDFLFFGGERVENLSKEFGDPKRKAEKVRGLIHILNRYKFTIVENTPIEQEIALDPELLGQVFENLLASYNDETKITARKQTGSFYTPRTIVDYMVDESLKAHLSAALVKDAGMRENDAKAGLDILFAYTEREHAFTPAEVEVLIRAIDSCKILDPACGSGAFPMGALQKLVYILAKLDPRDELWKQRQLAKVDKLIETAQDIDDTTFRERAISDAEAQKRDIEEAFSNNELGYGRKLYLIENCLYGVDIQSIATQVSKLRFFISLVVDQTVDRQRENFGVRPLPNLETKFVTADTLIRIEKPSTQVELFELADVSKLQRELKQVRHELFAAKTPRTKNAKRERDKELREAIAEELEKNGWDSRTARLLASWDPYDQNASASFFDPEWMFGQRCFDVVIGNPPYISHDKLSAKTKASIKGFRCWEPFADLYCYFIERSLTLLCDAGISCLITSNSFLRAAYGAPLRTLLPSNAKVQSIISIDRSQVFSSAIVNVVILAFSRCSSVNRSGSHLACRSPWTEPSFEDHVRKNSYKCPDVSLNRTAWSLSTPSELEILGKIESGNRSLVQRRAKIRLGLATGSNSAFLLNPQQKEKFVRADPRNATILKPVIRGRDVDRYQLAPVTQFLILSRNGVNLPRDFPLLAQHLKSFGSGFISRGAQGESWWNLRACSFYDDFELDRVVWIEMTDAPRFAVCPAGVYMLNTAYFLLPPHEWRAYALVCLLNSSVSGFFMKHTAQTSGMGVTRWFKEQVSQIPVPSASRAAEDLLFKLGWIRSHLADNDNSFLEDLIDACVMECYFPDHMAERNLAVIDHVRPLLNGFDADTSPNRQIDFLTHFHNAANAASHPIRNRLLRLTFDSPELLGVIKREGQV